MRFFLAVLLLTSPVILKAQVADSVINNTDSLSNKLSYKLDSLQTLELPDTLDLNFAQKAEQTLQSKKDSMALANKVETLATQTQHKIDSLSALNLPTDKYENKMDSLVNKYPDMVNEKLNSWQNKAQAKADSVTQQLKSKLYGIDQSKLPEGLPNTDNLNTNGILDQNPLSEGVGDLNLPEGSNPLEGNIELPVDELKPDIDNPIGEELNKVKSEVNEAKEKPKSALNDIGEVETAGNVIDETKGYLDEAGEINEDIKKAKEGDTEELEKRAEEEVIKNLGVEEELSQSAEFEKMRAELEEQAKVGEKYKDPEFVKQRIMEKSKHVSNDLLKEYKDKIAMVQAKVKVADLKDINVDSLINKHEKARPYQLKDVKFRDRIYTGLIWEITKNLDKTRLDLAPIFGLKYNMKLSLWTSYMYRIRLTDEGKNVNQNNAIYGPRVALSYDIWKGFYFRSTAEWLRVNVPTISADVTERQWKEGVYVGFGKDYKISKHVNGDMQVLYNLTYEKDVSPFAKKFNFRFGFYVDFTKRPPKPEWKKKLKSLK